MTQEILEALAQKVAQLEKALADETEKRLFLEKALVKHGVIPAYKLKPMPSDML